MATITTSRMISLHDLQATRTGAARLATGELVTVHEDISEDWNYYSKAWHRSHGPKRTVDRRWVRFTTDAGQQHEVTVEAFRGNYLLNALAEHLALPVIKVGRGLKPVQLFDKAELKQLHRIGAATVYERRLAGTHLDYVLVVQDKTFHAQSIRAAVQGWKRKECARLEVECEVLTYKIAREQYGFCHAGISQFCELNGLDIDAMYTRAELRQVVAQRRPENCALFAKELKTVNIATC